jgi:SAM-dependent methyltransferase
MRRLEVRSERDDVDRAKHTAATVPAMVVCPACLVGTLAACENGGWRCPSCGQRYDGTTAFVDLLGPDTTQTGDHYTLQWGGDLDFAGFLQANPTAASVMPASQLGWSRLLGEIAERAATAPVAVYDAGCGFGSVAEALAAQTHPPTLYVGADVHGSLPAIADRIDGFADWGRLLRWDITRPLPVAREFEYVICRATIHHTPDPPTTLEAIAHSLAPGGTIAVSAYARKAPVREAADDALRAKIVELLPEEAFAASESFTVLGRALQEVDARVDVPVDLPILGIGAGRYSVHELVYDHLVKCFYNREFGDRYSTLVNYDWYHPAFAHRQDAGEVVAWFERLGLDVQTVTSTKAQHYVEARRPA